MRAGNGKVIAIVDETRKRQIIANRPKEEWMLTSLQKIRGESYFKCTSIFLIGLSSEEKVNSSELSYSNYNHSQVTKLSLLEQIKSDRRSEPKFRKNNSNLCISLNKK